MRLQLIKRTLRADHKKEPASLPTYRWVCIQCYDKRAHLSVLERSEDEAAVVFGSDNIRRSGTNELTGNGDSGQRSQVAGLIVRHDFLRSKNGLG